MAAGVWSGERVVVFLVIIQVLSSIASSWLLWEAMALVLLAVGGLLVEIFVDGSEFTRFQTRRGASSGILLGTVSVPLVMLSRLIQLSSGLTSQEVGSEGAMSLESELAYLNIQYWSASVGGLVVLIFLSSLLSSQKGSKKLWDLRYALFSVFYFVLCATFCCLSLAARFHSRYCTVGKASWIFVHGLAAVGLVKHILVTFPLCASIGEAMLAASGLVLYLSDALLYTVVKANSLSSSFFLHYGTRRSQVNIIIQGALVSLLLFPILYKYVVQAWSFFSSHTDADVRDNAEHKGLSERLPKAVAFYALLTLVLTVFAPAWMYFVHDFEIHPILWAFTFVFKSPKRIFLGIYWLVIICSSVMRFYKISRNSTVERILLRKYYHLVAVLMFVPALLVEPEFLDLAFGVALAVFLTVEIIRIWRIWPCGDLVHKFMNAFTDHRDSDLLIVSHFSLLLGCALPKWLSSGFNNRPLAPFAGILSLGIGDTMASMVGHKYGVLRWSKAGKKTIEGTAAGITSVLLACSVLLPLLASTGYFLSQHWLSLMIAVSLSGLLEAYTAQLDNAFIPLVFYSLLCVT
ncbi:dolichol kinase EVAN [Nymphaea colorata]|nr:dolichol kinase EVAN [Nymphaea colorata]